MPCGTCGGKRQDCDECGGNDAIIAEESVSKMRSEQSSPSPLRSKSPKTENSLEPPLESPIQGDLFDRR